MAAAAAARSFPLLLHLDLKGAPPTVSAEHDDANVGPGDYFGRLLPWLRLRLPDLQGLLVEYEDQFPYRDEAASGLRLSLASHARGGWTGAELEAFLLLCRRHDLAVIPLVQTVGHLEHVLKQPELGRGVRECPAFSDCLCVSDEPDDFGPVMRLVEAMLTQVLSAHPDCPAVHLGGDEVWHLARGQKSQACMRRRGLDNPTILYLRHLSRVVSVVWRLRPGLPILIWDDMLRAVPVETLLQEGGDFLPRLAPVVWQYSQSLVFPEDMWPKYKSIFPGGFWAASAFKGATSSCAKLPHLRHHVNNQLAWRFLLDRGADDLPPSRGLILTGWQRFDHFAALCELLPVALPSLLCSVRAFRQGAFDDSTLAACCSDLGMAEGSLDMDLGPVVGPASRRLGGDFPGTDLYATVHKFLDFDWDYKTFVQGDALETWFNARQRQQQQQPIRNGPMLVSKLQLSCLEPKCRSLLDTSRQLLAEMAAHMDAIFPPYVREEWTGCFLEPKVARLSAILEGMQASLAYEDC